MEELAEPVPVFSAATFAVTALKVEGFPPSSHLSHPAKLPQSQDKGRLVRTCPAPSQARALGHPRHPGRQEAERPCPAPRRPLQQPCLWFRGLRSGHRRACCQRHAGLPPGPRPCILLTGLWNPPEPSCRDPSEVTQLSDPPSGSQGSGLSHPAADRMVAPGSRPPGVGVALPHQGD